MATGQRAMYSGREAVMSGFKTLRGELPYYSIWVGKEIFTQWNDKDLNAGERYLEDLIEAAEQSGNTDIMVIKFHKDLSSGYVTDKTASVGSVPVRFVALERGESVSGIEGSADRVPYSVYQTLQNVNALKPMLEEKFNAFDTRLKELERDTAPEVDQWDKTINRISGIISQPGVPELIGKLLDKLPALGSLIPKLNMPVGNVPQVTAAAPVLPINNGMAATMENDNTEDFTDAENDAINAALDSLSKHCDVAETLPLLAAWADNNAAMFKGLLITLKG